MTNVTESPARETESRSEFLISSDRADSAWAQWIATELEEAGYRVFLQEWDVAAGSNYIIEIDRAMRRSQRTIAVLSPNYLAVETAAPQWSARYAEDPTGLRRQLIPVLIAGVDVSGTPFEHIAAVDLVGLQIEQAREALLAGIEGRRARPGTPAGFPGPATGSAPPERAAVQRRPVRQPIPIPWRADALQRQYDHGTIELHTVAIDGAPLDSRALLALPTELTMLGRRTGFFDTASEVYEAVDEDRAQAMSVGRHPSPLGDRGLAVTRRREVAAWKGLPHDYMGSMYEERHFVSEVTGLLTLTAGVGALPSGQVGVAVTLEPIAGLQIGSVADIGRRSSAQLLFTNARPDALRIEATETVDAAAIERAADEIAAELGARMTLRLKKVGRL